MALLKLDESSLTLNIIAEAIEEVIPNERSKNLAKRVNDLKTKLKEKQKEEEAYLQSDIIPELQAIRKEIQDINEEKYPELKQINKDNK